MNFLAHLYLSDPTPASMIGNLLPDLVPGPLDPSLPPDVLAGANNHKRVDAFTDTHRVFARSRARLRPRHGRYSAILADMFYDHVLARRWECYHDESLDDFVEKVYTGLAGGTDLMPVVMSKITGRMIRQDWLRSYATAEGMRRVLTMMSARFSARLGRPVELTHAVDDLLDQGEGFEGDFHEFFPEVADYVRGRAPASANEKLVQ